MLSTDQKLLTRDEVRKAIHHRTPKRPPRACMLWHSQETLDHYGKKFVDLTEKYPDDVICLHIGVEYFDSPEDDPDYRWAFGSQKRDQESAVDADPIIRDWNQLGDFLNEFPDPGRPQIAEITSKCRKQNPKRYILENWGHYFHQRLAYLRGIENLLFDLYDNQSQLQQVMDALISFYSVWAERAKLTGSDGVWAGDDLGTQNSLFMPPEIFRKVYKPYYTKLAEILHKSNLDFWLHTCGNVTELMPDLIEAGVDIIHPIQVGTMDAEKIVSEFGNEIALWVGMDVQQLIPFGTPSEIREGIIKRAEIFYNEKGGSVYGAGNSLVPGIPFENIVAYAEVLDEFCRSKEV